MRSCRYKRSCCLVLRRRCCYKRPGFRWYRRSFAGRLDHRNTLSDHQRITVANQFEHLCTAWIPYNQWDLWDSQEANPAASLAAMRTKVEEVIDDCAMAADVTENSLLEASVAPNPTTGATTIRFNATNAEQATVSVYSVSGAHVSTTLYDLVSGANAIEINLAGMEAGTYFVKVNSDEAVSNMIPVVKK